jgi:hypothetical protein
MEVVAQYRDLLHNVLAYLGHLGEEEQREEARDAAEAGEDGAAAGGLVVEFMGVRRGDVRFDECACGEAVVVLGDGVSEMEG